VANCPRCGTHNEDDSCDCIPLDRLPGFERSIREADIRTPFARETFEQLCREIRRLANDHQQAMNRESMALDLVGEGKTLLSCVEGELLAVLKAAGMIRRDVVVSGPELLAAARTFVEGASAPPKPRGVPTVEEIEAVWDGSGVARIPGHDMTNECRLAARILGLESDLGRATFEARTQRERADSAEARWRDEVIRAREARDRAEAQLPAPDAATPAKMIAARDATIASLTRELDEARSLVRASVNPPPGEPGHDPAKPWLPRPPRLRSPSLREAPFVELLARYDDAVTARRNAVARGEPPFDRPLSPEETLATQVYRDETAARDMILARLGRMNDALDSAWAALGDNLESQALGGKGIDKPYAHKVQAEIRAAQDEKRKCEWCGTVALVRPVKWQAGLLSPPGKTPRPSGRYLVCEGCAPTPGRVARGPRPPERLPDAPRHKIDRDDEARAEQHAPEGDDADRD
jgi:hypothetical protein